MDLYIPACGDRIQLILPWTFNLYFERRNLKLLQKIGALPNHFTFYDRYENLDGTPITPGHRGPSRLRHAPHALPSGTLLEVARVYVRNTAKSAKAIEDNYDSVTWKIITVNPRTGLPGKASDTFWTKLDDTRKVVFHPVNTYAERKANTKTAEK
jgi:hypothetical protein